MHRVTVVTSFVDLGNSKVVIELLFYLTIHVSIHII